MSNDGNDGQTAPDAIHEVGANNMGKVVDTYIGYLRRKLGEELIVTQRGFGYALRARDAGRR